MPRLEKGRAKATGDSYVASTPDAMLRGRCCTVRMPTVNRCQSVDGAKGATRELRHLPLCYRIAVHSGWTLENRLVFRWIETR